MVNAEIPAIKQKKRGRGKHNVNTKYDRTQKWIKNGGLAKCKETLKRITKTHKVDKPLNLLDRVQTNGRVVQKLIANNFPGMVPKELESAPETGILLYMVPNHQDLAPNHPPYYVMRLDRVVYPRVNNTLMDAWDVLRASNVVFPKPDKNRSSTPALHLGIWEIFRSKPIITRDSRNQKTDAIQAIDVFMQLVCKHIAPKLKALLQHYCSIQYKRQQQLSNYVKEKAVKNPRLKTFDFDGIFFTVAVKEGSSERIHIDFNDDPNTVTWIVPLGDWKGGEFCIPQLNIKIPIKPGQVLGGLTRRLAHCSAPVTEGRRVILTLFTDRFLAKHGNKKQKK